MCRFLYLIGQLGSGGSERQLFYLLQAMDRARYSPAVAVWNLSGDDVYIPRLRALNVPVFAFSETLSAAAKLRAWRNLIAQLAPELVHSYTFYTNVAAYLGARSTRAIAVGSIRCDFTFEMKTTGPLLRRLSARWPRNQISNSSVAAETVRDWPSVFVPQKLFVVSNGLDLNQFSVAPPSSAGVVRIVGVGSLQPRKRWERLLKAARSLKRSGYDFGVQIVGDGPLRESLAQEAQALGVAGCVEFLGYSARIPDLLANATFVVHTSDSEGYPNAVMEAMACGRAVIATDAGDVPFLVEDYKTGFVVPREDEATLVARMATLITNPDLCRRMGKAGRAKAERRFGLDRLVSETLAAYHALGWRDD
jgi:glycosyltransferase involved in cell wall biosynthesis